MPPLRQPAAADDPAAAAEGAAPSSNGNAAAAAAVDGAVDEDELARCVGYFLRVCPGVSKVTIGELLGDPDKFFLKVCACLCVCVFFCHI